MQRYGLICSSNSEMRPLLRFTETLTNPLRFLSPPSSFNRAFQTSEIGPSSSPSYGGCASDIPKPDAYALTSKIRDCTTQSWISHGQQLHSYALRSGFLSNIFLSTALVNFYAKLLSVDDAHKVFVEIPLPNVVTWNTIITGFVRSWKLSSALGLFVELTRSEVSPDSFSYTATLTAVGRLCLLRLGMSVHSLIVKSGLDLDVFVGNCLIDMYGKCVAFEDAVNAFHSLVVKDSISWSSIVTAAVRNQRLDLAFEYFSSMDDPDTLTYNVLINGLAHFNKMEEAVCLLKKMPKPNSSSWNAIITGYVNHQRELEALDTFQTMHRREIDMDEYTLSSALTGVAQRSALTWGVLIHCLVIKSGLDSSVVVGTALIDMYSKCGQIENAELVFRTLSDKNIVTWNAILSGFAHNGESEKVIEYLEKLKRVKGLKPDEITLLSVLAACSHNQMPLETAYQFFLAVFKDNEIAPMIEHVTAMIRLMGSHGELWRAERMISELGFGSCGPVWRALLSACGACGDMEVGKMAARKVIELEGDREFAYVALSNINAVHGKWAEVGEVRELMRSRGVEKEVGCTWIEVEGSHIQSC